ncbi:MAG: hypothetical protein ACOX6I_05115 [Syntrophomonadaceae bacterium]
MQSKEFGALLAEAIGHKRKLVSAYEKYVHCADDNQQLRQVFETMLEKEQGHLEVLQRIEDNTRGSADKPTWAPSGWPPDRHSGRQFNNSLNTLLKAGAGAFPDRRERLGRGTYPGKQREAEIRRSPHNRWEATPSEDPDPPRKIKLRYANRVAVNIRNKHYE